MVGWGAIMAIWGGRGQNCRQHWGPRMGRYYHVVIVAELNIALPPWVVPLVEYRKYFIVSLLSIVSPLESKPVL